MESRQVSCPECSNSFRLPATSKVAQVKCPKCGSPVEVGSASGGAAAAAKERVKRPASSAGADTGAKARGAGSRTARPRREAPKKSPAVMVIAGVALLAAIGAGAAYFTRGSSEELAAAPVRAPAAKPDFSDLPDIERPRHRRCVFAIWSRRRS